MTEKQKLELREATQYLASAVEMLEDTIKEKPIDLDQLENDQNLIRERSRRTVLAIEDIISDY